MSCGNPVAEGEAALMQRRTKFDRPNNCIKCKVEKGNITIRHAVYCKNCFFPLVTTKFKRSLEPHINAISETSRRTNLKASGNLLVGFSVGLGSSMLLDMLSCIYFPAMTDAVTNGKGGKAHPRNKRVWTNAYACYVEICNAFPEGKMRDRRKEVQEFLQDNRNFKAVLARIEDAFDLSWWNKVQGQMPSRATSISLDCEDLPIRVKRLANNEPSETPISLIRTYLNSLPTPTAVQTAISSLTRLVLIYTAHHLQCSHLALGTSLTSMSISLINSIAQGGGFHVREEFFEEWRDPLEISNEDGQRKEMPIRLVKPLRDVGMKECAAWMYWKKLPIIGREKLPTLAAKQTIGSLTKNFIIGLERDYPSTVSTIVRTCDKVTPKDEASDRCALCERPTPAGVLNWKARISVRSRPHDDSPSSSIHIAEESEDPSLPQASMPTLSSHLCYACHTLLTSKSPRSTALINGPVYLPQWANARLAAPSGPDFPAEKEEVWSTSPMGQEKMQAVVDEYLL